MRLSWCLVLCLALRGQSPGRIDLLERTGSLTADHLEKMPLASYRPGRSTVHVHMFDSAACRFRHLRPSDGASYEEWRSLVKMIGPLRCNSADIFVLGSLTIFRTMVNGRSQQWIRGSSSGDAMALARRFSFMMVSPIAQNRDAVNLFVVVTEDEDLLAAAQAMYVQLKPLLTEKLYLTVRRDHCFGSSWYYPIRNPFAVFETCPLSSKLLSAQAVCGFGNEENCSLSQP